MGLFRNVVPRIVENLSTFLILAGENGYGFKVCSFHCIIKDFIIQGGDFTNGNVSPLFLSPFSFGFIKNEIFIIKQKMMHLLALLSVMKHVGPGVLSMANVGLNTNRSQIFICTVKVS
ncbi:hypothetical protein CXB51_013934 [Gossypium anomalum]|uniref:Peptidyl-prolyl cis-trans isomerase n=1 Tax=Gossypium anomalum TaxID=47600 RepID=A0A8J5YWY3_9ROSI|nr:hypothetical protein CXB51_013934 [Gossypium anomalum]